MNGNPIRPSPMHQAPIQEPDFSEDKAQFEAFFLGWSAAGQGRPLRPGACDQPLYQRRYREGYEAGMRQEAEDKHG
jgi:hypothetical protein